MIDQEVGETLRWLLTSFRDGTEKRSVGITEVFLAALGIDGLRGFQVELGFGNGTTLSFQAADLPAAVEVACRWVEEKYR